MKAPHASEQPCAVEHGRRALHKPQSSTTDAACTLCAPRVAGPSRCGSEGLKSDAVAAMVRHKFVLHSCVGRQPIREQPAAAWGAAPRRKEGGYELVHAPSLSKRPRLVWQRPWRRAYQLEGMLWFVTRPHCQSVTQSGNVGEVLKAVTSVRHVQKERSLPRLWPLPLVRVCRQSATHSCRVLHQCC